MNLKGRKVLTTQILEEYHSDRSEKFRGCKAPIMFLTAVFAFVLTEK